MVTGILIGVVAVIAVLFFRANAKNTADKKAKDAANKLPK